MSNSTSVEEQNPIKSASRLSSVLRKLALVVVILGVFALVITSISHKDRPADKAWTLAMTTGSPDASHHYIMYTDLMCPYCDVFSRETLAHWDEFQDFLAENDILFEIRLTDALYTGSSMEYSRDAAEVAYCAARENQFWEFYHAALTALWDDYQSKGVGSSKTATPIKDLPEDYWLQIGRSAKIAGDFESCVENRETADQVTELTKKAMTIADGMPTFQFGKFYTSGFGDNWDWDFVKQYLEAGLQ